MKIISKWKTGKYNNWNLKNQVKLYIVPEIAQERISDMEDSLVESSKTSKNFLNNLKIQNKA